MFEELNRYAEKLQRPTGVLAFHACPARCYVERNISDHWTALCQTTNPRFFASLKITKRVKRRQNDRALMRVSVKPCITLVAMSWALAYAPLVRAESKTILVFGDSLSDGFMLKRSEAYPALLAKKLRAAGLNFQVINASASGGTTDGGLERLPTHLKAPDRYFGPRAWDQRRVSRTAGRSNRRQSAADHRKGESAKSECASCDRRIAATALHG